MVDKDFCMSSYLTFRHVIEKDKLFKENLQHNDYIPVDMDKRIGCDTVDEVEELIKKLLNDNIKEKKYQKDKMALLLSGGIDSAILASYMPKGTKAYTARCVAPGAIDETEQARKYCEKYDLEHIVVDVSWEDYLNSIDYLMLKDGCPVNSNEPQIYKLSTVIKENGGELIIFGDAADMVFGGYSELLCKDWKFNEWVNRYTYLDPKNIIKNPVSMKYFFEKYRIKNDDINFIKFMDDEFSISSTGAYYNAFLNAEIDFYDPYAYMKMTKPFDLKRIRSGDSKHLLRQLFQKRYPELEMPEKIAMPRAVDYWMRDWTGPTRDEFLENCIDGLTGKQKFQVFALERFLNLLEK